MIKRYRAALGALNKFRPGISFHELNEQLFLGVKKYCKTEMNLKGSTTVGYFNADKKVVHWSQLDGHISKMHEESIFGKIHIQKGKAQKDHLEIEEIQAWKNVAFRYRHQGLVKVRDMFLLQIYTGFYYSDLKELRKNELRKDHDYGYYIYRGRYKNDHLAIVPLWKFPYAMEIIEKYRSTDPQDPYLLSREAFMIDQVYNRRLKEIAKLLKWNRNIRNKLARQTNSQLYIRFGAHRPIVSNILGHEREETTNAYFEVNLVDVIEGTKHIDFERLGIC